MIIGPQSFNHNFLKSTEMKHLESRCLEEDHCIILARSSSSASKCSNTRYRCKYCDFEFVGGPQKIRVHLTGKRENSTRLSRCEKVPTEIKTLMEGRMKTPKVSLNSDGIYSDDDPDAVSLTPRNIEENYCVVLSRSKNVTSKSANSKYKCLFCRMRFTGGPQKIRVHLTGIPEGSTKIAKCLKAPPDVIAFMECRRKLPKSDL